MTLVISRRKPSSSSEPGREGSQSEDEDAAWDFVEREEDAVPPGGAGVITGETGAGAGGGADTSGGGGNRGAMR